MGTEEAFTYAWDELSLLTRLPCHPNILPLDRVVLEDVESRIIGYTTRYNPGRTLMSRDILFRFEWLQQLVHVVDHINLNLGIMHQDIAPRNLLIDPESQKFFSSTSTLQQEDRKDYEKIKAMSWVLGSLCTRSSLEKTIRR